MAIGPDAVLMVLISEQSCALVFETQAFAAASLLCGTAKFSLTQQA
jgi:hypothetical protein